MAVLVMLVLATLALGVLGRTLAVMAHVRDGQDFDAALAAADAGLSAALFEIDQSAPASWTATGTSGAGTFQYWAVKENERSYVVSSVGRVGGTHHGIRAKVERSAKYPYALFSRQPLRFNGSLLGIDFNPLNLGLLGSPGGVRVGSNDTVVCHGTIDPDVWIDWYQSQSGCASPRLNKMAEPVDLSFEAPTGPTQPCPADGVFGLSLLSLLTLTPVTVNGMGGVPFVCRRDVTIRGTVLPVNGPVKIYVLPTVNADGSRTYHELDMSLGVVNTLSPATNFQIFKEGPAALSFSAVAALTFRGILVAPETTVTVTAGHLWWAGSVNVLGMRVNGAPNIKIGYDFDLEGYLGIDWKVSRYREIPSSEAATLSGGSTTTTTAVTSTTTTTTTVAPTTTTLAPTTTTTAVATTTTTTTMPTTTTTKPCIKVLGICVL